jgi:hypothetical protein
VLTGLTVAAFAAAIGFGGPAAPPPSGLGSKIAAS